MALAVFQSTKKKRPSESSTPKATPKEPHTPSGSTTEKKKSRLALFFSRKKKTKVAQFYVFSQPKGELITHSVMTYSISCLRIDRKMS